MVVQVDGMIYASSALFFRFRIENGKWTRSLITLFCSYKVSAQLGKINFPCEKIIHHFNFTNMSDSTKYHMDIRLKAISSRNIFVSIRYPSTDVKWILNTGYPIQVHKSKLIVYTFVMFLCLCSELSLEILNLLTYVLCYESTSFL